jgi:histidinol-phosphate/aromatic aminotransferase/cobyric acid decarboxylase-like protein
MYDTGLALPAKDVLLQLVSSCAQRNVTVLVDEAFIDLHPSPLTHRGAIAGGCHAGDIHART